MDDVAKPKWEVTLSDGKGWRHTAAGDSPEQSLEECLDSYDADHFPDRDRLGGFN